jgi:acetyltransferase-like isoleucine patch superfamily enzyme
MRVEDLDWARTKRWFGFGQYLWAQVRAQYTAYRSTDIRSVPGVICTGSITVLGAPLVKISEGACVLLGADVVLDSQYRDYHANMFAPVKLLADAPGARIEIGADSRIHGACIHARKEIRIGKRCLIAANCQIIDSNGHDMSFPDVDQRVHSQGSTLPVHIEDSVWLGLGCIVLPGVTIGRGTVVGAGSVVTGDLPGMCFAAGSPARVVRRFAQA